MASKRLTHKNYKNKLVFITGGAHGIGLRLCRHFKAHGAKLIIIDVNEKALDEVKVEMPDAHFFKCDITVKQDVYDLCSKVISEIGIPDFILNNAGVVENHTFLDCPDHLLERTMNVNIMSHFWVLKGLLPEIIKSKKKVNICEVASAAGLIGIPGLVGYCTSKHAVVGFSSALRLELEEMCPGQFTFTTVCPSPINTGLFAGAKAARLTPILDQDEISEIIFEAIDEDKEMVMEPFMVKTIPVLKALLPTTSFNKVLKFFKVTTIMDDIVHKGRSLKSK